MKSIVTILICSCVAIIAKAQVASSDSLFIVTYTTGSTWDPAKKPNEQSYFKEHSANLSSWRKSGAIKFGARYAEKGIIVIAARSFQEAKGLVTADPAVQNKLFDADVQRLSVFYDGCVAK